MTDTYRSKGQDRELGHILRMCGLKTTFYSEEAALKRCQEIADPNSKSNRKNKRKAVLMRPYQCRVCHQWHLTRQGANQ